MMIQARKPIYKVPSMAEIAKIPKVVKAASLFSGGGGSLLGLKLAAAEVAYAAEFVPEAIECYRANHPDTYLDTRDVRDINAQDIINVIGAELDILDGSPPCQSFSTAGARSKGWGKERAYSGEVSQRSDDLFFEYARILNDLQPKGFIAENVTGLVKGTAKGYFVEISEALQACGYCVSSCKIDCQWLGVPQARERVFFMGIRKDLNQMPVFPRPFSYRYTIKDLFPYIKYVKFGGSPYNYKSASHASPTIMAHDCDRSESAYFSGGGYIRTIDGETRQFTIAELKKVCAFPDDFYLNGNKAQQWERLGRAVPPLAMKAIADSLIEKLRLCNVS